ncbi:50S ribosomal protein L20 [Patescibacteria group bacterium]|nr:50S ribosomal protein L20 [Patescibacteria group bacterium]
MARVKRGIVSRRKHNKLHALTKGYRGTKSKLVKVAKEAALHAGQYAYHGRKLRKRNMRSLWILRIGEAVKKQGISYSLFISALKKKDVQLDRKILNEILSSDPNTFEKIVETVKSK